MQLHGEPAPELTDLGDRDPAGPSPGGVATPAAAAARAPDAPTPELEAALAPMLEAMVRIAGASAGTVGILAAGSLNPEPVIAVGLPRDLPRSGAGAIAFWCDRCNYADRSDPDCANNRRHADENRLAVEWSGPVCRRVVAVPLRYQGDAIGRLDLLFESEYELSPHTMPLLRAAGELIGVAIANARLTRENLRASLVSERQSMANEVHDSLAQGLTYMRMRMNLLRDAIRGGGGPAAVKYCGDVDESLTNAHRCVRELITYFRSRMDPRGLRWALTETAASFPDRTGVELDFDCAAPDLQLPVGRELEVFHIVQEALANVSRHANATRARLTLDRVAGDYEIVIEDNGIGMPVDAAEGDLGDSGHFGIAIMSERARRLGGRLTMEAVDGSGTRVRLRFPAVQPQDGNPT